MATKYIVNNVSGQTIDGNLTINGDVVITGTTNTRPYNVYTALLTQVGNTNILTLSGQPLEIGVTYQILSNGNSADFTNVGAPNNEIGTFFVATGTDPNTWGTGELEYNTASPTVKVLENTIGYIWYEFLNNGVYAAKIDGGWDSNKSWYGIPGVGNSGTININPGNTKISFENSDLLIVTYNNDYSETVNQQLVNTPIEIRVYN